MSLQEIERQIAALPDGKTVFFEIDMFPWITAVEARWSTMRQELDRLMQAMAWLPGFEEIQAEQAALTTDTRWKILPLFAYGRWVNQTRCPVTCAVLEQIPQLQAAMFSILEPGKDIPPHRGPYSGVLRYHLGLQIPEPPLLCGITVAGETRHWQEGQSLVFDDSHLHHAWNHSTEVRVVLFVDFERPLPAPLAERNRAVIQTISASDFIVKAIDQWEAWDQCHGRQIDAGMAAAMGVAMNAAAAIPEGQP
jgi:beta-hydroxylase